MEASGQPSGAAQRGRQRRHVNNLVQVLPRTPRRSLTGTSTTSRCTPTGMQQPVQTTKNCNCGSSAVSFTTALELYGPHKLDVDHLINVLQQENLNG